MAKVGTLLLSGEVVPTPPFVRQPYNYDTMAVSNETGLDASHDGMTKQEFTHETDPNYIMDRFIKTGDISHLNFVTRPPMEGDYSDFPESYHAALNFVKATERDFLKLDAKLRAKFENDPQNLLIFLADDANFDQAYELGLIDEDRYRAYDEARTKGLSTGDGGSPKDPTPAPVGNPG